ncbi:EcsC family protein [Neokomagataea anthophila]|uniref:EcsC family protein n=1 Tax=Neokomagataea anthophila TaxID=2826925 RepID=A0ABS5E624_9PROT|nr:EcsC family protein [Neokomagataea anthophila]MBR0559363.1 EcsC family protein [Neokomagataea anthophila]
MTVTNGAQLPSSEFVSRALDGEALAQLQAVLARVEQGRGTLVRLADLMGGAVGQVTRLGMRGLGMAPAVQQRIEQAAEKALRHAFDVAIVGMAKEGEVTSSVWRENASQAVVAVSGALGGFGGVFGLAPDIGVTTLTIMREIARIAREEGEDLTSEDTRHACLEVFALRSFPSRNSGEEGELGFFSARALLRGRPIVMLMSEVAAHYGIGLSRKFALQMVPVAGALCGASLNAAFLSHYRALARAHFTIRRLERTHGRAVHEAAVDLHAAGPDSSEAF